MKKKVVALNFLVALCLPSLLASTQLFYKGSAPPADEPPKPSVDIDFVYVYNWDITNREGKKLAYCYDPKDEKGSLELSGTMEHVLIGMDFGGPIPASCRVPFSESFTFSLPWATYSPWGEWTRKNSHYYHATFYDGIYFEWRNETNQWVSNFGGTIVFHSDNVVELFGDVKDVEVNFCRSSNQHITDTTWTACGSGGLYAKFSLVGDEVIAEGMTGGYTVTKYDNDRLVDGKPLVLYTKAYDETGKEIPYVPPEEETKEDF